MTATAAHSGSSTEHGTRFNDVLLNYSVRFCLSIGTAQTPELGSVVAWWKSGRRTVETATHVIRSKRLCAS